MDKDFPKWQVADWCPRWGIALRSASNIRRPSGLHPWTSVFLAYINDLPEKVQVKPFEMISLRLSWRTEWLFRGSLVTTHPVQVSPTCLENLAAAPSSSSMLNLERSCFIRLSMDKLLYHSQLMSFPLSVPGELLIYWLTDSSMPGLIIINTCTHSTYLQLFRGTTFQPLLPPWQALTVSRKLSVRCATSNHRCTTTVFILTFSFITV